MKLPRWIAIPLTILLLVFLAIGFGIWGAIRAPALVSYDLHLPGWAAGAAPLRIVQLSDTHANRPFMSADRLDALVARVNAMKPDIVVLTGDYLGDGLLGASPLTPEQAVAPFAGLKARLGTYAVLGNHDHRPAARGIGKALQKAGVRLLDNDHARVGPVTIAGVDDFYMGRPDLDRALSGDDPGVPVILLSHEPDIFPEVGQGVALTLAGHTHGGQIASPLVGAIFTGSQYGKRYLHGHVSENGHDLIVSAGLGTSVLPLRVGVRPEIVSITIH